MARTCEDMTDERGGGGFAVGSRDADGAQAMARAVEDFKIAIDFQTCGAGGLYDIMRLGEIQSYTWRQNERGAAHECLCIERRNLRAEFSRLIPRGDFIIPCYYARARSDQRAHGG